MSADRSRFLRPGEQEIGWVARTGRIPLGYYNDPETTERTFPEIDGQRVVIPGDRGTILDDGTLRLFGRDSQVVNTGGEKVFVEEVEEVLRAHPVWPTRSWSGGQASAGAKKSWPSSRCSPVMTTSAATGCTTTAAHSWRISKCPRSSSSSHKSSAWATASPTIDGLNRQRHNMFCRDRDGV
ncbi:AMP-binding enzyme family protein [Mycobacterium xenopi 4042]|uniref:AMP-binding enzyme family protein n=1 Tax=Mycobacterium xenopi 4042 TaxID=1299334 RepID=X8E525_MYCXE|nr:AMP-binding enzyme family protein [Mycobacterium xenopi 4042]